MLLNWGCGSIQPAGWVNADSDTWVFQGAEGHVIPPNPAELAYQFPDAHFDGIVANHSLQQVSHHALPAVFAELARVTKPGGWLRVLVPDVVAGFDAYKRLDRAWFPISAEECPSISEAFSRWLTWYGTNCTAFTPSYLYERAGCGGWIRMRDDAVLPPAALELDDREGESLVVTFTRP